jgi:hypothetical protein
MAGMEVVVVKEAAVAKEVEITEVKEAEMTVATMIVVMMTTTTIRHMETRLYPCPSFWKRSKRTRKFTPRT